MEEDGILIIDKPAGWTSHDVVAKLRGILKTRRIGHTGTLDPFATGVLVICVNRATRIVQFLTAHEKEYAATIRLGWRTETGDLTGPIVGSQTDPAHLSRPEILEAIGGFRGKITQIPPMFSAKKVAGKKLYELARAGKVVERAPIEVTITRLDLVSLNHSECEPPALDIEVRIICSAGTYIRTLAEDIGHRLGIGAHLVALRRLRAGKCRIEQALTLEEVARRATEREIESLFLPMESVLDLPVYSLNREETSAVGQGRPLPCPATSEVWNHDELIALCGPSKALVAIGQYNESRRLIAPRIVLAQ